MVKRVIWLAVALCFVGAGSRAQENVGPVTGLKLPRFVSMKRAEANVRRGPSKSHRIDWVFVRKHMPLKVVAEYEHWRMVEDSEGEGGWVHYALLSGQRSGLVSAGTLPMRYSPRTDDHAMATLEPGVIVLVETCDGLWCRVEAGERVGWVLQRGLWGVERDERIE